MAILLGAGRKRKILKLTRGVLPRARWSDRWYAVLHYRFHWGFWPRLSRPRRYSEHLLKLMRTDLDSPLRCMVSDKELVKAYIADTTGHDLAVPTLAVLRTAAEIDGFIFPDRCVVKPTHSSGQIILKPDSTVSVDRQRVKDWLDYDFYTRHRERNYRGLDRKVIVEPFVGEGNRPMDEYKIHCFFGRPKLVEAVRGRHSPDLRGRCYSARWEPLPIIKKALRKGEPWPRPACMADMVRVAEELAARFSSIRVDFYSDGARFFVGEMTNLDGAAVLRFQPDWADIVLGQLFEDPDADPVQLCSSADDPVARKSVR